MGADDFYPDERPMHERTIEPFEMQSTPTTNAQFAEFVADTGYMTVAERVLSEAAFPLLSIEARAPGSLVFRPTEGPVDLQDWRQWWSWTPGAQWRHPSGPGSTIVGLENHPVVQVALEDAVAYCGWADARLPTESEHEYAAGGGNRPDPYAWGTEREPEGQVLANTWRGSFPYRNEGSAGWTSTSPVGTFPPNGFGLFDLIGNVWEWTSDRYTPSHADFVATTATNSTDRGCGCGCSERPASADEPHSFYVLKGGSHLCAPDYCHRFRPAARSAQTADSATTHIGFRPVRSL